MKFMDFVNGEDIKNIEDIDNISAFDLLAKISYLDNSSRYVVLNNPSVKNKLRYGLLKESIDNQWYYYREILKFIDALEFLSLYDAEFLNDYFTNNNDQKLFIFFYVVCEKDINKVIRKILNDNEMFSLLFNNCSEFNHLFSELDYELLTKIIYKIQNCNNLISLDFVCDVKKEFQYKLLEDKNINDNTLVSLIDKCYYSVRSVFFEKDSRALYLYNEFDIPILIKNGVRFNDNILAKKDFFEALTSHSFIECRDKINYAEKYNNPIIIEESLEKYYDELLSSYSYERKMFNNYWYILNNPKYIDYSNVAFDYIMDSNVYDYVCYQLMRDEYGEYYYNDRFKLEDKLKIQTNLKISEIVIDSIFRDNIYNVWLNINEMLRYNTLLDMDDKVLGEEKVNFYNMILNFDNVDNSDKINLYNKLKNKNYSLIFYEDLKSVKEKAYDKIKSRLFNVSNTSIENNKIEGVDVYDLRELDFTMLVRSQSKYREVEHYRRNCYSIISNLNTSVFGEYSSDLFLYGYNDFDNQTVLHMFESDSYSSGFRDQSSRFVNRIMTADELVMSSDTYSEVQLINLQSEFGKYKFEVKRPDFIVVFDVILSKHIEEAKRLNIPIVIIKKKRLNINKNSDSDGLNMYVSNYFTENEHRIKR